MVAVARAAMLGLLWLAPGVAAAQLAECAALGGGSGGYKVVIDEISWADVPDASKPSLENLKQRIAFTLNTQLQEFQSDVASQKLNPAVGLGLVNCVNRRPSMSGAEFTSARVETLNDQRVVVELWGSLLVPAENPARPHAIIGYVIPPVVHYLSDAAIPGQFLIKYPKDGQSAADAVEKLPEASAFALVGLAVKARKALKYDLAVWAFNLSEGRIHDAQKSGNTAALGKLLAYVRLAKCQTRESARADAQYRGPLTLTPKETCVEAP